jgi:sugar/nucleoside kinase (ribokinase family)
VSKENAAFDVCVVGEINLDLIMYGLPEYLAPDRELLANNLSVTLGSSSAICAHNLASLGSRTAFVSLVGEDPLGQVSLERLAASGADVSRVKRAPAPAMTGLTVVFPYHGRRYILTYPGVMSLMRFEDLDLDFIRQARHLHVSSFFLHRALRPQMAGLFRIAKEAGMTTSLDTNDDPEDKWELGTVLRYVDVFFPNDREARKVARKAELIQALDVLSAQVPLVVVKCGRQGAVARRGKEQSLSPVPIVEVVDTIGAGDSFNAGFLHQFVRGEKLETCLAWGNLAGSFSITRAGGTEAFRERAHLEKYFREHGFPLDNTPAGKSQKP